MPTALKTSEKEFDEEDLVLVAMPSFCGRAPAVAIERFRQIRGNGAKCTIVCVYGNRAYEDTLVEMEDAAKEAGFQVIAAVAAVAEHSIMPQYAANRPDAADEKQLAGFAAKIASRDVNVVSIPGNRPCKKSGGGLRGIYAAGVSDYCMDQGIRFVVGIGMSAGSANLASYTAGQKGRNYQFYTEYAFR